MVDKNITQLKHSRSLLVLISLFLLSSSLIAFAQPENMDIQRKLDLFDSRLGSVRELVNLSRSADAARFMEQAIRFRNDAESALRQQNINEALAIIDRALSMLAKAEDTARQFSAGEGPLKDLQRLLQTQRQRLQEARQRLQNYDTNQNQSGPSADDFINRQAQRTLELIEQAEQHAQTTETNRDNEMITNARNVYEQALQMLETLNQQPVANDRGTEARLRDIRTLMETVQQQLALIERQLNGTGAPLPVLRNQLQNTNEQIRRLHDQLQEVATGNLGPQQSELTAILGLLRRASELSRLSLGIQASSADLQQEYETRHSRVLALRQQVDAQSPQSGMNQPMEYQQANQFLQQAESLADQKRYEEALPLLAQSATLFNRALARLGANLSLEGRTEILNQLQEQFEKRYQDIFATFPNNTPPLTCAPLLQAARSQADQSNSHEQQGNLMGAFGAINQAQKTLMEALNCLGMQAPRVQALLDRLQAEYDRRYDLIQSSLPPDPNPAAMVVLNESKSLRDLSDSQEADEQYDLAVRTVGRAVALLGNAQRLLSENSFEQERELVSTLQTKFDERIFRVREVVEQSTNPMATSLLDEAENLRASSESSLSSDNVARALSEIGRAIQLLEQALNLALQNLSPGN